MSVAAATVQNAHTGTTATLTLSGAPNGAVTFLASRTPYLTNAVLTPFSVASGVYTLTFPHPGLYYIWPSDTDGVVASAKPGVVWVSLSDEDDLDELGFALQKILLDNIGGLEAALKRAGYPNTTVKQITYGFPSAILEFPSIVITNPSVSEQYVATGMVRQVSFQFTIAFMIVHDDEQTELPAASRFARAGMLILNQPANISIPLPSGVVCYFCAAQKGEMQEVDLGDRFAATGTLVWTGNALYQDAG